MSEFLEIEITLPNSVKGVPQLIEMGDYGQATQLLEGAIAESPEYTALYWYLGLAYLLQGDESEAYLTWIAGLQSGEGLETEKFQNELGSILEAAASQQEANTAYSTAWSIRRYLQEINPENLRNLLKLIQLAISANLYTGNEIDEFKLLHKIKLTPFTLETLEELATTIQAILTFKPLTHATRSFILETISHLKISADPCDIISNIALKLSVDNYYSEAITLLELYREIDPDCLPILRDLCSYYRSNCQFQKAISIARYYYGLALTITDRLFAIHELMFSLVSAGTDWQEACLLLEVYQNLLKQFCQENPQNLQPQQISTLMYSPFLFSFFKDSLKENRQLQNDILNLCHKSLAVCTQNTIDKDPIYSLAKADISLDKAYKYKHRLHKNKKLKIGYLSYNFRKHPVGFIARWLMKFHDQEKFDIYAYPIQSKNDINDELANFYKSILPNFQTLPSSKDEYHDYLDIAEKIYQDKIDILIELDSLTLALIGKVLTTKPAPIQVSWLGWDAPGLSTVDYFIADPYVLPDYAQAYYPETIWRLPNTYVAVSGFEIGVPKLRRVDLNVPDDAILYYSGQTGRKRHPDTIRLQMKILSEVPNSYFLIKGVADEANLRELFGALAEAEGVSCDRLRFLSADPTEAIHRANLGIADVVLDTYPYNGATTTLETLWMGVPLVTRVGEQLVSRNSYTMLVNAGIEEGIAWTDEEYVVWGIRFGTEPELRQRVSWKLRQSRHSAPLWNARQFARDMETAYQQMWEIYGNSMS